MSCRQDEDSSENEKKMKLKLKSLTFLFLTLLVIFAASSQGGTTLLNQIDFFESTLA